MKKNGGFIAISLIYSFFLLFLMTLVLILSSYVQNRILLSDIKKSTINELNELSEFNPISLENKTYTIGEKVSYANEDWYVINSDDNTVTLMLKRTLTNNELLSGMTDNYASYTSSVSSNTINMCYSGYDSNKKFCFYYNTSVGYYNLYYWEDSLVKFVIDNWFNNNALLQKAKSRGTLIEMNYSDERKEYTSYIRIPIYNETSLNTSSWCLTYYDVQNSQSRIRTNKNIYYANQTKLSVQPVIKVSKNTSE